MNPFFEGLVLADFSTPLAISGTISATASDDSLNSTALFGPVVVGQWIRVANLHAEVDGFHLVISKPSTSKIILATNIVTDRAGSGDETIKGSLVRRTGAVAPIDVSFSKEKQFLAGSLLGADVMYQLSLGNYVQQMGIEGVVEQLLSGSIQFLGQAETQSASSGAGSPAEPPASEILGPILGLPAFYEGTFAALSTLRRSQISWQWNNNHAADRDLGAGNAGIGSVTLNPPTINATVRINRKSASFRTSVVQKFIDQTRTRIAWRYVDTLGNAMMMTFPRVLITNAPTDVGAATGTRYTEVSYAVETDEDAASPHYQVAAQFDWFAA
jgi:hypothetical protein